MSAIQFVPVPQGPVDYLLIWKRAWWNIISISPQYYSNADLLAFGDDVVRKARGTATFFIGTRHVGQIQADMGRLDHQLGLLRAMVKGGRTAEAEATADVVRGTLKWMCSLSDEALRQAGAVFHEARGSTAALCALPEFPLQAAVQENAISIFLSNFLRRGHPIVTVQAGVLGAMIFVGVSLAALVKISSSGTKSRSS